MTDIIASSEDVFEKLNRGLSVYVFETFLIIVVCMIFKFQILVIMMCSVF